MWPSCTALERDGPPPTGEVDPNVCSPRVLPGRPALRIVVFLGCTPSGKGGLEPQGCWKFYFLILVVVTRGCGCQPESLSGTLQAVKLRGAGLRRRQGELVDIRAVRSSRVDGASLSHPGESGCWEGICSGSNRLWLVVTGAREKGRGAVGEGTLCHGSTYEK